MSVKIIGTATLVFSDTETGEVLRTHEETNHIQKWFMDRIVTQNSEFSDSLKLFVSSFDVQKQRRDVSVVPNSVEGTTITNTDAYSYTLNVTDNGHSIDFTYEFVGPAETRTIRCVGLTTSVQDDVAVSVHTLVHLSSPCYQEPNEKLQVFYRVQVIGDNDWLNTAVTGKSLTKHEIAGLTNRIGKSVNAAVGVPSSEPLLIHYYSYKYRHPFMDSSPLDKMDPRTHGYSRLQGRFTVATDNDAAAGSNASIARRSSKVTVEINQGVGRILSNVYAHYGYFGQKLSNPEGGYLQSIFGHSDVSEYPFGHASYPPVGVGQLEVDTSDWPNSDWPEQYVINITASGNVGVGQYNVQVRKVLDLKGNTYENTAVSLPFTGIDSAPELAEGFKYFDYYGYVDSVGKTYRTIPALPIKYYNDQIIFLKKDEFAVVNLFTGFGKKYDQTTVIDSDNFPEPRFLPTSIHQVAVTATNEIYVACATTGLYKFNDDQTQLDVINSDVSGLSDTSGCFGVCAGYNNRVWAFFNHITAPGLFYSDDGGATWAAAVYTNNETQTNPEYVLAIQADQTEASGKLHIAYTTNAMGVNDSVIVDGVWWDEATGLCSSSFQVSAFNLGLAYNSSFGKRFRVSVDHKYMLQELVKCSPNGQFWAVNRCYEYSSPVTTSAMFNFGELTSFQTMDLCQTDGPMNFTVDENGDDAIVCRWYNGIDSNGIQFLQIDGTIKRFETLASSSPYNHSNYGNYCNLYLGDSIWLNFYDSNEVDCQFVLSCHMPSTWTPQQDATIKAYGWKSYGWTGSTWELNHPGVKTIHSQIEALPNGVTIRFSDNDAVPPSAFDEGDRYTFGVCDGVWLDGSTTFDYDYELYYKPSRNQTSLEFNTLPANERVLQNYQTAYLPVDNYDISGYSADDTNESRLSPNRYPAEGDWANASYARSLSPVIKNKNTTLGFNCPITHLEDEVEILGEFQCAINPVGDARLQTAFGLFKTGTISAGEIAFPGEVELGFYIEKAANTGTGFTVEARQNGVVVGTYPEVLSNTTYFSVAIRADGTVIWAVRPYAYNSSHIAPFVEIARSSAGAAPNVDYSFSTVTISASPNNRFSYLRSTTSTYDNPKHFLALGNAVEGMNQPEFLGVDEKHVTIVIDGVEAFKFGENDFTTPLVAGNYVLFPEQGVIRYSPDDVGKSITAKYITVSHV